ncbi:MAG: DUF3810 domain-containing protein [Clostridia bacterium]|nr:DUF3810 domain-containing protein [Clostridia bacterium]
MAVIEKQKTTKTDLPPTSVSESKKKIHKKFWIFTAVYFLVVIVLNILARIKVFCDFYTDHIFRIWAYTYGRLTSLAPFSVGEILVGFAVCTAIAAIVISFLLIFLRKRKRYVKFTVTYLKSFLIFLLTIALVMTLNCSIPYGCSKLNINGHIDKKYSVKELEILRSYIVEQCNTLCGKMERDENHYIVKQDNIESEIKEALRSLKDEYPRFGGYYPDPKGMFGSYFMYQANVIGVYFPFSMEANYTKYLSSSYYPSVVAHELTHLKGYMFENEANFFSYLACTRSDNDYIKYSGYLSVLYFVDDDYKNCVDPETYASQVQAANNVLFDNYCYDAQTIEYLKSKEHAVDDKVVESFSDTLTDTYLSYYNAEPNYDEVTLLLLQYYDGILY